MVPIVLVAWQLDLGTAILIGLISMSVALILVRNLWPILGAIAVGGAALPVLWHRMEPYRRSIRPGPAITCSSR